MTVEGNIFNIGETATFGAKGFRKRELVLETVEQFPQKLLIEFLQDDCEELDGLSAGELVEVSINLRGRIWTNPQGEDKYFNSLQGLVVEKRNA